MKARMRQLMKAYHWLENAGEFVSVVIPSHVSLETGRKVPATMVDVHKDELIVLRQIYGKRLVEIIEAE